jgi:hypothetical protein
LKKATVAIGLTSSLCSKAARATAASFAALAELQTGVFSLVTRPFLSLQWFSSLKYYFASAMLLKYAVFFCSTPTLFTKLGNV